MKKLILIEMIALSVVQSIIKILNPKLVSINLHTFDDEQHVIELDHWNYSDLHKMTNIINEQCAMYEDHMVSITENQMEDGQ